MYQLASILFMRASASFAIASGTMPVACWNMPVASHMANTPESPGVVPSGVGRARRGRADRARRADAPANRGIELVNGRVIPDLEMVLGVPFAHKHVSFSFQKPEKQDSDKIVLI